MKIQAREILDSRSRPTISVTLTMDDGHKVTDSVPSGASVGIYEALELRDGDEKRYNGLGVLKAIQNINQIIAPKIIGMDPSNQFQIDQLMIDLDNTENKSNLGANAILAVSMVVSRAAAYTKNIPLYQHISNLSDTEPSIPQLFFNVINGGNHADNILGIQEFMISPQVPTAKESVRIASETYNVLKNNIKTQYGGSATLLGDEGGFAPAISKTTEVLDLLNKAIAESGYEGKIDYALDVAASEFYTENNLYNLNFKGEKPNLYSSKELLILYTELVQTYPIISIEDPYDQDSFADFALLKKALTDKKVSIVGDDLTVSNPKRITKAIKEQSCDTLLLKINQIGTISEAITAFKMAQQAGWSVMVSHRSGETTDSYIADFAVGLAAESLKSGATARGERVCKYNRIMEIEQELENKKYVKK